MKRLGILFLVLAVLGGAIYFWTQSQSSALDGPDYGESSASEEENPSEDLEGKAGAAGESGDGEENARSTVEKAGPAIGAITGRILDSSGRAIQGATVILTMPNRMVPTSGEAWSSGKRVADVNKPQKTAADGRFSFVPVSTEEKLRLLVRAPRMLEFKKELDATSGRAVALGDLRMQAGIVFVGRVLDARGKAVQGASVVARPERNTPTFATSMALALGVPGGGIKTDKDGKFEIVKKDVGTYEILATHPEHVEGKTKAIVKVEGEVVRNLLVQLQPSVAIEGTVTGIPSGSSSLEIRAAPADQKKKTKNPLFALVDSPLALSQKRGRVDKDGKFRLGGLEPGAEYRLAAFTKSGGPFGVQVSEVRWFTSGARNVEIAFARGIVVVFDVVDAKGERFDSVKASSKLGASPLDIGAMLSGMHGPKEVKASDDGRFRLPPLRPTKRDQKLTVSVRAEGYKSFDKKDIPLPVSGEVDLGTIKLLKAPMLRVYVTDASGEPVPNARVSFEKPSPKPTGGTTRARSVRVSSTSSGPVAVHNPFGTREVPRGKTDEEGIAELTLTSYTSGSIRVTHRRFADKVVDNVAAKASGATERKVQLSAGGSIVVTVTDARGKAVKGARVSCLRLAAGVRSSSAVSGTTNDEGRTTFRALVPGEYDLTLQEKRGRIGNISFSTEFRSSTGAVPKPKARGEVAVVTEGRPTRVQLVKPDRTKIVGVVTLDGAPLAGASVRVAGAGSGIEAMLEGMGGLGALMGNRTKKGKTKSDGRYEVEDVKVGLVKLEVRHKSLMLPQVVEVRAVAGETRFDIALKLTRVRGIVVDASGKAVANATVMVEKSKMSDNERAMSAAKVFISSAGSGSAVTTTISLKTKQDGTFELPGVPANQPIVVTARSKNFADGKSEAFTLRPGETRSGIRLVLAQGGSIDILVPADKVGLGIVTIRRPDSIAGLRTARLDNGKATVTGLSAGTWRVALAAMGEANNERDVEVTPGKTTTVDFSR